MLDDARRLVSHLGCDMPFPQKPSVVLLAHSEDQHCRAILDPAVSCHAPLRRSGEVWITPALDLIREQRPRFVSGASVRRSTGGVAVQAVLSDVVRVFGRRSMREVHRLVETEGIA